MQVRLAKEAARAATLEEELRSSQQEIVELHERLSSVLGEASCSCSRITS